MTITVFGSINIDVTAYSRRLPAPGETIHGSSYVLGLGGKGANQAVAVARLGGELAFVGRIGRDAFGAMARAELERNGVKTGQIADDDKAGTGIAIIAVDADAQNCITVIAGANFAVDQADVTRLAAQNAPPKVLLLQLEVPMAANIAAATLAKLSGALVILDPAPMPEAQVPDELMANVGILTPNEIECEALTGIRPANKSDAWHAAAMLRADGAKRVVIKMGANGAFWMGPEGEGHVPAFPVKAIDTVAAGDCFNGGLAVAIAAGKPLGEAVRFASACAALSTTKRGAAAACPTLAEVERLLG
jgi:ribokinase